MLSNFDIIDNILFRKKPLSISLGDDCVTWVINKGLSFHSKSMTQFINATTNQFYDVLDAQEFVDFLNVVIPKLPYSKIRWIKSTKLKKTTAPVDISVISNNLEISQREYADLLDLFPEFSPESTDDALKTYRSRHK